VPLRLYAGGTVVGGSGGPLATAGAGPSLLYGAALNLEPGAVLPGLRLDLSESRTSHPGFDDLTDRQRRLVATAFQAAWGQRFNLGLRLENDHREGAGDVSAKGVTLDVGSARHQTTVAYAETRRTLAFLTGLTADRQVNGTSEQRWHQALTTQLAARWAEVEGAGATGSLTDARAAFVWRPLQARQQLTLSGSAGAGSTRTSNASGEVTGRSVGGSGRAAYGHQLGPVNAGLAVGAATTTSDGRAGNAGTTTQLDATASVALVQAARAGGQVDYTLVRALAPLARGGDRLEHHARAFGRLTLAAESVLTASLAWDDGRRELLDITTGAAVGLHERAASASLGANTRLGRVYPSVEVRHARNSVVADDTSFVAGSATQVRSVTSALAGASWNPRHDLGLQGQLRASWTELRDERSLTSMGANLQLTWRLGRLVFTAQYQAFRSRLGDAPASFQQSIRGVFSRPFEL
jgi:hypothetical protein